MDHSYNLDICYNRSKRTTTNLEKEEITQENDHVGHDVQVAESCFDDSNRFDQTIRGDAEVVYKKFIVIRNFKSSRYFKSR